MVSVKLYGLTRCSTCLKALAWLEAQGVATVFQDYRDEPVAAAVLTQWAQALGGWEKLVNRASMTWRNLDQSLKSPATDQQWLALIAQYPALVRRPVTVYPDQTVSVGFNEKRFAEKLGVH
ncbi:Spx/MgsR family RNA polymerase-binding regulatory protein [Zwartia sp.]|uniref:Spx/MgsR family RNA polymerase-binding regulatory protein n=1 Tax=Zwartia sp. TaxID=2978004 RepID=UPI0027185BB3|nr:Spx/MgsR family RNA polymerase-binding regulatory protein [Zwartia sp.]MDO9023371.1 Spx/MgsR family RNA polymerase-binding regulatory protein [Zwartia sp.]